MEVFLLSIVIFLLAVLGMSVGTIFGRRELKTSCRGGGCGECDHSVPHECLHPEPGDSIPIYSDLPGEDC
ncbi:MAG: hypothetical protein HQ582_28315 [Planctomycetes bacterium]|nr:hypothetical protein [Planctomycetota bacterium]